MIRSVPLAFELLSEESYDRALVDFIELMILLANFAGALVIAIAVVRALASYLVALVISGGGETPKESVRLSLGRSLSLALEFQLGADILGTALDPSREDLIILGAIAALRTILNFFLGRELAEALRRKREEAGAGATGTLPAPGEHHASAEASGDASGARTRSPVRL